MAKHEGTENAKNRGNYVGKHRRAGDERETLEKLRAAGGAFRIDRGTPGQKANPDGK